MKHKDNRVPARAGQRAATVEQRALQVEAELRRLLPVEALDGWERLRHELRQALAATWDDGEATGERTLGRQQEAPVPTWHIPGRGEAP